MKILGTILRFLCALVVLLAVAVYLDGPLQVTLLDYLKAFTPEHLLALTNHGEGWPVIAAGALLLLTLCCGLKLGWNIVYSLITFVFFAEAALLVLGPELALPTATRGLGWEGMLREITLSYPVPTLMIPALCILGCLCSNAPVRIAFTSLICCALTYGCAELLCLGVQHWKGMEQPFLPKALSLTESFPWAIAALPAIFFLQYGVFMAVFETFVKNKATKSEEKEEGAKPESKEEGTQTAPSNGEKAAGDTVTVAPTPVVVKRPVVHKKSPITPAPAPKKETPAPEVKAEAEEAPAEEKKPESVAEAPKPEAGEAAEAPAPSTVPETDTTLQAEVPAAEKEASPAAIPSVPLPSNAQ